MDKYIDCEAAVKFLDNKLYDNPYVSGTALSVVKNTLRKAR